MIKPHLLDVMIITEINKDIKHPRIIVEKSEKFSRRSSRKIHFYLVLRYFLMYMIHKKVNIGLNQPMMHVVQLIVVIMQVSLQKIVLINRIVLHTILQIHQQQTNHRMFKFVVCNDDENLKARLFR
jgi:hypothetical protein